MTDQPIGFTITNDTTHAASLSVGVTAGLTMTMTNSTGADIALAAGAEPATFVLYLPSAVFSSEQFGHLTVTAPGWSPAYDSDLLTVTLACTTTGTWKNRAALTFAIANAASSGPPTPATASVLPANVPGNVPVQIDTPLAVVNPPHSGNLSLPTVLQATLENQGLIYRCDQDNPLINKLFLTLKNIGPTALATSSTLPGSPQVLVSFVYGSTSGALAEDTVIDNPGHQAQPVGPAWHITAQVDSAQLPWTPTDPQIGQAMPKWQLKPSLGNTQILGPASSDQANVTFVFDQVISATPAGHTQMFVLCTGFAKDEQTRYDDHLYVLDINKQDPPPTLGVVAFSAGQPVIKVTDPKAPVAIDVKWTLFGVDAVSLITSSAAVKPISHSYPGGPLLSTDGDTVIIDPPATSEALFMTLQALNATGSYLNAAQYTAYLELSYVCDPDGTVYPVARFGDRDWMTRDYAYATTSGSYVYADQPQPPVGSGLLYTAAGAREAIPEGWSLPTVADWQALVGLFADPGAAYAALITGGSSGFGAALGGLRLDDGSYNELGVAGCYRIDSTATPLTQFSGTRHIVSPGVPLSGSVALAVRYVRRA